MELDTLFPSDSSDLDLSFTSCTSNTSTERTFASSSARSSLTLSFNESRLLHSSPLIHRPHRKSDPHWSYIHAATNLSQDGTLQLPHLKLVRHLGSGNLGRVFLCRLKDFEGSNFALKVVDRDALTYKKLSHVQMETEILSMVDHPFLPTLYAHLEVSHYTSDVVPTLETKPVRRRKKPRFFTCFKSGLTEEEEESLITEFVAEPVTASSKSCVGTHEYLAPELVNGNGHGNGVDWWAFGVFIYELLYGRTPFKGESKECTLRNIVSSSKKFKFQECDMVEEEGMAEVTDLISKLLVKDSRMRLGCVRGATDIKVHPFFKGIKWPLIRTYKPPELLDEAFGQLTWRLCCSINPMNAFDL
ncbi:hypothetical protein IFM89_010424 [Coptis chinensis]|uniref:non-specific serine/threonine protein kinase n=1 Tax=Coptis chinensis TaxID=261450 RepID=A0A835HYU5_9MAGN|nr:hypothetical protein IFM89_010424 [Coptis chinensis]